MKIIKYNFYTRINRGTDETPMWEETLSPVVMGWNEANEEIAKKEAYNGEYEIFDDGQPDPADIPTKEDELEARLTYVEMMTGLLEV